MYIVFSRQSFSVQSPQPFRVTGPEDVYIFIFLKSAQAFKSCKGSRLKKYPSCNYVPLKYVLHHKNVRGHVVTKGSPTIPVQLIPI
jgi:hypothetical protein